MSSGEISFPSVNMSQNSILSMLCYFYYSYSETGTLIPSSSTPKSILLCSMQQCLLGEMCTLYASRNTSPCLTVSAVRMAWIWRKSLSAYSHDVTFACAFQLFSMKLAAAVYKPRSDGTDALGTRSRFDVPVFWAHRHPCVRPRPDQIKLFQPFWTLQAHRIPRDTIQPISDPLRLSL